MVARAAKPSLGEEELVLTVVAFKWKPPTNYRNKFEAWHVNRLAEMFKRHLHMPFEFVCVTDSPEGIEGRTVPLWEDHGDVPSPHGGREPSCYRRLKLFSAEVAHLFTDRILWCDLDMVLTRDVTPLFDRPESAVLLSTDVQNIPVNGSLVLFTPSKHRDVWEDFDPGTSPRVARKAGFYGSDQGWLGHKLLPKAATWKPGPTSGIYFFGQHMRQSGSHGRLPHDARLVSFHGRGNPFGEFEQSQRWVREHYGERPC